MADDPQWPRHACGLYISHNEHRDDYRTVGQAIECGLYDRTRFPDDAEIAACIAADSVWEIHWYPDTPIGFHRVYAATFARALALAMEVDHG